MTTDTGTDARRMPVADWRTARADMIRAGDRPRKPVVADVIDARTLDREQYLRTLAAIKLGVRPGI
jgi:hypothetical protein